MLKSIAVRMTSPSLQSLSRLMVRSVQSEDMEGMYQLKQMNRENLRKINFHQMRSFIIACMTFIVSPVFSQDLDPRAYIQVPVKSTTMITGFAYSHGGVVTDATLPVQNINADVQSFSVGVARSFDLFGLSSQALIALPYSLAQVTGDVNQQASRITRSGFGDMRLRLSVLFHGAPAATLAEMRNTPPHKTILGASLNIVVPTGQFFSDKLINLGTHRWSFRPELALSQRIRKRWTLDAYAGVWLFTNNASFYPGSSLRKQDPMSTFQAHFSYNINPQMWVAFDATFYTGGSSSVNGVYNDDRQSNARFGITAVVPTGKLSSLKFSASTGAVVRVGQDFSTYSIGWQHSWIPGLEASKIKKSQ
jgi:hypothetical protein